MKRSKPGLVKFFVTVVFFVAACAIAQAQLNFEGYRGPGRDGIAPADVGLADSWADLPGGKPVLLWQSEDLGIIGIDHTNGQVAVWDGYSYTTTYKNGKRVVWCFDSQGHTQWSKVTTCDYPGTHAANPSVWVTDGKVYFHDDRYEYCCDAYSGAEIWKSPRAGDQKTSPVVVDGVYINRQDNYVGLNAETGAFMWSVSGGSGSVGSAVLWVTPAKTYVVLNLDENNNVSCVDPLTGSIVWRVNPPGTGNDGAPNTSPLCLNDVMVLTTRNLDVDQPQVCYRLFPDEPSRQPELMWANGYETTKSSPVIFEDHIFWGWTTRHNSFAQCTETATGDIKYRVNNPSSLPGCMKGYGDLLLADGKLFGNTCLSTTMAWPNSESLEVISTDDNNANHQTTPTIVNGLMYVMTYRGYSDGVSGEQIARVKCYDISARSGSVPQITQTRLRTGKVDNWYTERLWVSSGNGLRTWSLQSGTLPPGLVLDGQNHILSGYPTTEGSYTFTLEVQDQDGDKDSKEFTIVIGRHIPVTAIVLNLHTLEVGTGLTAQLAAELMPEQAENRALVWKSESESVAVVDASGLVTGVNTGKTKIIATSVENPFVADTCEVSVFAVNRKPMIDNVTNKRYAVNSGSKTIVLTGISDSDNNTQTLSLTATTDNDALLSAPIIDYTSGSSTAILTVSPVSDATGTAVVRIRVKDSGGIENNGIDTTIVSFTITVSDVLSTIPGRIEAEDTSSASGEIQITASGDVDGTDYIGWFGNGDELFYTTTVEQEGSYLVSFRVAAKNTVDGSLQLLADGTPLATVAVPSTGGWTSWQTITAAVNLTEGPQTLSVLQNGTVSFNLNWIDFEVNTTQVSDVTLSACPSGNMHIGDSRKLSVAISPALAADKSVNWLSSDEQVATVDSEGNIEAISLGQVKIYAVSTSNTEIKDSCTFTVAETPNRAFGINDQTEIRLFPNPCTDVLNVVSGTRIVGVKIYNTLGNMVRETALLGQSSIAINVSHLASGIYLLRIVDAENQVSSLHFYKN